LPDVLVTEGELRDALTNLILNAVDAMPDGGRLTLRTHAGAHHVSVEVSDTGVGMDEDTKRRCLEPFFTTKGERGTGMGLAMVYGMAQRHGVDLEIDSTRGQGTTFRLIFAPAPPACSDARPQAVAVLAQPLSILIVDDDPLVLESMRAILQSDGHTVTAADGGQAGIDAFTSAVSRNDPFAVVITDLGMPHIDGRKVAATVKAASPSTPIVLLTGWGRRMAAGDEMPPHVDRLLGKPPSLADLRRVLAEVAANDQPQSTAVV
jgi:CheY-like chemotaxis protein